VFEELHPAALIAIGFLGPLVLLFSFQGVSSLIEDILLLRGVSSVAWAKENGVLIRECSFIFGVNVFAIYLGQKWCKYRRQRRQSAVERI
jgi:hypothetical protein